MMQTTGKKIGFLLLICLISLAGFGFLYTHDNKYTASASVSSDGGAVVVGSLLSDNRVTFLSDGWHVFPDKLINPKSSQLKTGHSVPLWIGQYLTFSNLHSGGSPYGTATYVLNLTGASGVYSLLLPEVYSACRVYVNGRPAASSGSLKPYAPGIQDVFLSFSMDQSAQILIQTANYSHYYSGLTYPPVLGSPEAVYRYSSLRMIFYGFLCFSSLATALFSIAVWLSAKKRRHSWLYLLFAGLAVSFSIRISYPFMHLTALPATRIIYALEDSASLFGIWCALGIIMTVNGCSHTRLSTFLSGLCLIVTAVGIAVPLFMLPSWPALLNIYGPLISWYKLLIALFLMVLSLLGTIRRGTLWAAAGTAVYAVSLLVSVLSLNRMEPAYTGWPDEYGAYVLVLCFAGLMVSESRDLILDNMRLTDHLQAEVDQKTRQLSTLVNERQRLLSEFLHDIKSPISALATYTSLIRSNNLFLDENTRTVLDSIETQSLNVSSQIRAMQDFTVENPLMTERSPIDLADLMTAFYQAGRPDADARGIYLTLEAMPDGCVILGDRQKLNRALQNLFYNALDFTPEDGEIRLALRRDRETAVITICDNGCGIAPDLLPRIFDRLCTGRPDSGGTGLGLYLVKITAQEHGGTVSVSSSPGKGSIFSIELPLL